MSNTIHVYCDDDDNQVQIIGNREGLMGLMKAIEISLSGQDGTIRARLHKDKPGKISVSLFKEVNRSL